MRVRASFPNGSFFFLCYNYCMVFIAGADTVTVKGRWQAPDGTPASGTVELSLDLPTSDAAINVSYTKAVKKYTLDNNGEISVPFIITTDSSLTRPVALNVKENFDGASTNKWQTTVQDHGGGIFYLSKASPIEPRPLNQYVLLGAFNTALAEAAVNTTNAIAAAGTVAATGNTVVRRDSSGRAQFASPAANNDAANKSYVDNADSSKAPIASPTFTGVPAAPTAAVATNTTQLATTAFTQAAVNAGTINLEVPMRAGDYYSASFPGTSSGTFNLNSLTGSVLVPARSTSLVRIGVRVTVAGSTGAVIRLGVYTFNFATNGATLVQDAGTVDATTTGYKELTINASIGVGQAYFIGAVIQGAPTTIPTINIGTGSHPQLSGNSSGDSMITNSIPGLQTGGISGALPSTLAAGSLIAAGTCAKVVVRA